MSSERTDSTNREPVEPGDHAVDVPITCVLTRFGLRKARDMIPSYRDYQSVLRELERAQVPGFLRAAFLVQNPTTWYSLSFWAGDNPIPHFGTNVPGHVTAAHRGFSRLASEPGRGPELWSTKWRLQSVSNNLNWDDFDLRGEIRRCSGDDHDAPD